MADDSYSRWVAGLTENTIRAMFVDRGCDAVFRKVLAPNDNTKNQIYLAGDLTEIARIPSGPIGIHAGTSTKRRAPGASIFRAPLDLVWITDLGAVPAPEAKLIYYPQYPEVRASGLLRRACPASVPSDLGDRSRRERHPGLAIPQVTTDQDLDVCVDRR